MLASMSYSYYFEESRMSSDPKDWVFPLEYEFKEPKNSEDLKCHLVAISMNRRHNIPNVIKSHWQFQPIPIIENIILSSYLL